MYVPIQNSIAGDFTLYKLNYYHIIPGTRIERRFHLAISSAYNLIGQRGLMLYNIGQIGPYIGLRTNSLNTIFQITM